VQDQLGRGALNRGGSEHAKGDLLRNRRTLVRAGS
jgi:hypothetical protein